MPIAFNGTTSKLTYSGTQPSGVPLSVFGWVKLDSTGMGKVNIPFGFGDAGVTRLWRVYINGAGSDEAVFQINNGAGSESVQATSVAALDTWMPLLITQVGSTIKIYFRGGAVQSKTIGTAITWASIDTFAIGFGPHTSEHFLSGEMTRVAVWTSELSQTDFNSLATTSTIPSSVQAGSLWEYWALSNSSDLTGANGKTLVATSVTNGGLEPEGSGGDTTAPVLTSPTGTATGSTTATAGATTDEGNGTMYAFVSTSATPPSAADLKAGTDAVWSGSQAVSSTGAKTFNATGLTASTGYYAHLIHTDAAANDSNIVSSAQFTTSAPASPPTITDQPDNATVKRGQTATFTTAATGSGTVTYQWQRNPGGVGSWADISGATSASYTTPATTISGGSANDQDDYRCNVSDDDAGPVATDVVTLTVQQCVLALNAAGYEFGDGNDLDTLAALGSTELQVAAYPLTEWPPASAIATATATTASTGRLADLGDDDLVFGTTYRVIARNAADGETWAWTMTAT